MADASIKKVKAETSPVGDMGQRYLVSGKRLSMRLWVQEPDNTDKEPSTRDYETIGFVLAGKAELNIEGQRVNLESGDSWLVPAGALHCYKILEPFTAVEATAPPAEVHARDEPAEQQPLG